jgi:hypothetical protein
MYGSKALFFTALLMVSVVVSGCGPSAEQQATMTAMVWTATPIPTATSIPTATPRPTPSKIATVVYRNGTKMVIEDWQFEYQFGESDTKPSDTLTFYKPIEKTSDDLYLQFISGNQTMITGDELSKINFIWEKEPCLAEGVEIQKKNGETFDFGFYGTCDWKKYTYQYPYVDISDSFLSNKAYVLGKELFLLGRVWQDGEEGTMKRWTLKSHYAYDTPEEVQEITFP